MEYLEFWQLKYKPFETTQKALFFFESKDHGEALARLQYLVEDKNMHIGVLTGQIGCGKTTTWEALIKRITPSKYKFATLDFSSFPFEDILREVICQISDDKLIEDKAYSKYELVALFKNIVINEILKKDLHLVIILDEAQQISEKCLDDLKNLTNIAYEEKTCLSIIFVGQPELRDKLRKMPQINQRVGLRYHLNSMAISEVPSYIKHRIETAGSGEGNVFSPTAIDIIARESQGVPREINKICKLVFDRAYALGFKKINEEIVNDIVKDFQSQEV